MVLLWLSSPTASQMTLAALVLYLYLVSLIESKFTSLSELLH